MEEKPFIVIQEEAPSFSMTPGPIRYQIAIPSLRSCQNIKEIRAMFERRDKIHAIQRFRELCGYGLRDSKYFIEYWEKHPELDKQLEDIATESEIENKAW